MKKENPIFAVILLVMMGVSFYAGYQFSPLNIQANQKDAEIKSLKEVVIQQQLMYTAMMRQMPQFKIKNWAMNK